MPRFQYLLLSAMLAFLLAAHAPRFPLAARSWPNRYRFASCLGW